MSNISMRRYGFLTALVLVLTVSACALNADKVETLDVAQVDSLRMQADAGRDDTAMAQLQRAAKASNVHAQRALGSALVNRATPSADKALANDGLRWLGTAAQAGDADAQLLLGKIYLNGSIAVSTDKTQARAWFVRAAQAINNRNAAYYLGVMDRSGYGGPVDHAASVRWLQIAADAGLPDAMFLLGNAYTAGEGVPQDRRSAMHWYMQAAALEHPLALQEVAYAFQDGGRGLPRSEYQSSQMMRGVDHALRHAKAAP